MMARCPRCGAELQRGSRSCARCGLEIVPVYVPTPPPSVESQAVPSPPPFGNVPSASGLNAGNSVVKALTPPTPPRTSFWVGLTMLLSGLLLAACPSMLGGVLFLAQGFEVSQALLALLGTAGCFVLLLFIPGFVLMRTGRAHRL
ncbi:MAG: hypothetical protein ABI670_00635 [Chloroflexota bacterium]